MRRLFRMVGQLILAAMLAAFFFYAFLLLDRVWPPATVIVAAIFYLPLTINLLTYPLRPRLWQHSYTDSTIGGGLPGGVFSAFALQLLSFSFLARGAWMFGGQQHFRFLYREGSDPLIWILYGVDNFVRAILFDVAEIYGFSISGIDHERTIPMATFVLTYRMGLSLGLLSVFVSYLRRVFTGSETEAVEATTG